MTIDQRKYILNELESIAGKYNHTVRIKRKGETLIYGYVWRKTKKGNRAYDWTVLLVLADKARDLGCDVQFCYSVSNSRYSWRYQSSLTTPCPERLANAIAIFLPI